MWNILGDGPLTRFIAEMNREAVRMGMEHTAYKNTSGLTAEGHHASAGDLALMAHAAMQDPLFRKYVSTRQHGCTLACADGGIAPYADVVATGRALRSPCRHNVQN